MATLHMEVEAARSTASTMKSSREQVEASVQAMGNSVTGLVGSGWQGNSASEFLSTYEQWRSTMTQLVQQLNELTGRLDNEINQWEQMAAKLE